jgi:Domain of unknown function (DUF4333)
MITIEPVRGRPTETEEMQMTRSKKTARLMIGALALVAAGALAAGCGGTVDTAQMEQDLVDQLAADAGVDPADVSVACPDDEKAEEGNEFECTLTAPNGDEVAVEVTITDGGDGFEAVVPRQQFG